MSSHEPTRRAEVVQPSGPDRYALLVRHGDSVSLHPIPQTGSLELGRGDGAAIVIDDNSVSRRHACITAGSPPMVQDLHSTNGTRVMGRPLPGGESAALMLGSMVQFGQVAAFIVPNTSDVAMMAGASLAEGRRGARGPLKGIVVEDPVMRELYGLIDIVAPSTMPVLILGETGVGKDVYCETIHKRSPRARSPFLSLNCAALPENTLEGELFGYERGAFTGAVQAKQGLFESADGGTVFLDEIGDLPLLTQAKLLRVLEKGEVLRLGGLKVKTVDVRFISATNRDLQALASVGKFRPDLFFRLNGVAVTIPPLRRRPDDVPALARHFLQIACEKANHKTPELSQEVIATLVQYRWPGNIRELRNVMDRAALLGRGELLLPEHLMFTSSLLATSTESISALITNRTETTETTQPGGSADVDDEFPPPSDAEQFEPAPVYVPPPRMAGRPTLPPAAPSQPPPADRTLKDEFADLERQRILDALERCGGNQSRAAKLLGISRGTLIRRLEAYQVVRPRKRDEP